MSDYQEKETALNENQKLMTVDYAERKIREYIRNTDEEALEDKMYELVDALLDQSRVIGSANSFHNFAVNFSKFDDSETACEIVEKGLLLFPNNTDLLADYIQMGSECGKFKQCDECYKKLIDIGFETWTWRAFSFTIDYLLLLCTGIGCAQQIEEMKNTALAIVAEYRKRKPNREESYCSEADIYDAFNEYDKKLEILQEGIRVCKSSPKCSLRYADALVDSGEYEKANSIIQNMLSMVGSQENIKTSYVYYLSGLCKYAIAVKSNDYEKTTVNSIYDDFTISCDIELSSRAYLDNMTKCIKILENRSKIEYEDAYPNEKKD